MPIKIRVTPRDPRLSVPLDIPELGEGPYFSVAMEDSSGSGRYFTYLTLAKPQLRDLFSDIGKILSKDALEGA